MGKSWENHGKIMGTSWENHGKIMGKDVGESINGGVLIENLWSLHRKNAETLTKDKEPKVIGEMCENH